MDTQAAESITDRAIGVGHNAPPPDLLVGDALRMALENANVTLRGRAQQLVDAESRLPEITDDEVAGRVADYIKQLTSAAKTADTTRVGVKEPYLEGGRNIDGFFKGIIDPLLTVKKRVEAKLTAYLRDKAERERREREAAEQRAREEAERAAAAARAAAEKIETAADLHTAIEAEDTAHNAAADLASATKAADAKPADLSRTRGDYGAVASLRTTWTFEVVDMALIPREFLMVNEAALKAHLKARLKDKPPAPVAGVRFYETTNAVTR